MKTLEIQIHTRDWRSISDSLEKSGLSQGNEIQISDEVTLRYEEAIARKGLEFPDIFTLKLILQTFSATCFALAIEQTANLLWEITRGHEDTTQLLIERTIVEIDQGEIKRVITERLEELRRNKNLRLHIVDFI
jgi:hypothetical protein